MNGRGCYYCGQELIWMADHDLNGVYGEGEGMITHLECSGCGAEVEYICRISD